MVAPRATRRPLAWRTKIRSSPISAPNAPVSLARAISASASALLPEPEGPKISVPLSPWIIAVAWRLVSPGAAAPSFRERGQFDDEAGARAMARGFVGFVVVVRRAHRGAEPIRAPGCTPRFGRHGLQRSGARSKDPNPNSGRNPGLAGLYRTARKSLERMGRDARPVIVDGDDDVIDEVLAFPLFSEGPSLERNAHHPAGLGK